MSAIILELPKKRNDVAPGKFGNGSLTNRVGPPTKARKPREVVRTYPLPQSANVRKTESIVAMLAPWQAGLVRIHSGLTRARFEGARFPKYLDTKPLAETSVLTQRQWKSVTNQAFKETRSWEGMAKLRVAVLIRGSKLPKNTQFWLYQVNAFRAWWFKDGSLLLPTDEEAPPAAVYRLSRQMIKQVTRTHPRPRLGSIRTMLMDSLIVNVERSRAKTFDYWVKISTLDRGHRVMVPLSSYEHMETAPGRVLHYAQVRVDTDNQVSLSLLRKNALAPLRGDGAVVGLDWGLSHMFATSDGQLLGNTIFPWLKERDAELLALTRALQKQGIKLRASRRYRELTRRIREHMVNEVNRILNQLSRRNIRAIVVEKLDFRGGGMSPSMNHLLSKSARATVRAKLTSLTETAGIAVTYVHPAYTSQQCASCTNIDFRNRSGELFRCRFCGRESHADVNGARTILGRSHNDSVQLWMYRGIVKKIIDAQFTQRWGSPPTGLTRRREPSSTRA
ncbi:transposase, IS605 OrfB family, central region [Cryobacterium psychrotolerans]|uniref:Transposase, IS605 OrfB family, central region n=1 Tax=Cryobacterium psychrotolerans TaxID=386301 RepID=A0A1G9B7E3_9MICO|nr:zinc ribbon domain-containing protein [Cryobacterium psychrotolerans]SDK35388.1 transposase, IS605 OrfB family, central region [Cryobacterium psychrotolerans]